METKKNKKFESDGSVAFVAGLLLVMFVAVLVAVAIQQNDPKMIDVYDQIILEHPECEGEVKISMKELTWGYQGTAVTTNQYSLTCESAAISTNFTEVR